MGKIKCNHNFLCKVKNRYKIKNIQISIKYDEKEKIDKNNDIILPVISPNKSLRMEDINNDNLINDDENKLT